jgi:CDP-diacylglycerol pyrophosphatase
MRAWRVVRVLLPLVIVLVVVAGVVAVLSARPDQQDAKRNVQRAWAPLANDLTHHYVVLTDADKKVLDLSGPVRELAADVRTALDRWQTAVSRKSVAEEVRAANALEAVGRRLVGAARVSNRVKADAATKSAVDAFALDQLSGDRVNAFNDAVRKYARERRGPVRSVVASLLGNQDIPAFEPAPA